MLKNNLTNKLIFLALITTSIVTIMSLSKFQSTVTSKNNTKVALYAINADVEGNINEDLKIDCAGEYNLNPTDGHNYVITNEVEGKVSEVAVSYKIKVEFEEKLPDGITINVKDINNKEGNGTVTENTHIFENKEWKFTAGTPQMNTITITFTGENSETATSTIISNVKVSVIAEQID